MPVSWSSAAKGAGRGYTADVVTDYGAATDGSNATTAFKNMVADLTTNGGMGIVRKGVYGLNKVEVKGKVGLFIEPGTQFVIPSDYVSGNINSFVLGDPYSNYGNAAFHASLGLFGGPYTFNYSRLGVAQGAQSHAILVANARDFLIENADQVNNPNGCLIYLQMNGASLIPEDGELRGLSNKAVPVAAPNFGTIQMTSGRRISIEDLVSEDLFALSLEMDYGTAGNQAAAVVEDISATSIYLARPASDATLGIQVAVKLSPKVAGSVLRNCSFSRVHAINAALSQVTGAGNIGGITFEDLMGEGNGFVPSHIWHAGTWVEILNGVEYRNVYAAGTKQNVASIQRGNVRMASPKLTAAAAGGYGIGVAAGSTVRTLWADFSGNPAGRIDPGGSGTVTETATIA